MPNKNGLSFIKQYITKPRTVGAVLPSSKYLADKMTENINFNKAKCIVEYGAGTGVFTDNIIKQKTEDTMVLIFENNMEFYNTLNEKYSNIANIYIINDSAEHVGKYLHQYGIEFADYIISGLPFASLPQEISTKILHQTKAYLKPGGSFITFQYTLLKKDFIEQFFPQIDVKREVRNVPPAYVFCCRNITMLNH